MYQIITVEIKNYQEEIKEWIAINIEIMKPNLIQQNHWDTAKGILRRIYSLKKKSSFLKVQMQKIKNLVLNLKLEKYLR